MHEPFYIRAKTQRKVSAPSTAPIKVSMLTTVYLQVSRAISKPTLSTDLAEDIKNISGSWLWHPRIYTRIDRRKLEFE